MKFRLQHIGFWLLFLLSLSATAQVATLKGSIQDNDNKAPIAGALISIKGTTLTAITSNEGFFEIKAVPFGNYTIEITAEGFENLNNAVYTVTVSSLDVNVGVISMAHSVIQNAQSDENIPTVTLSDSDLKESNAQNVSGVLSASRDPFTSAATYNFSAARFRPRGYENEEVTYINGMPAEDLINGRTIYSAWGGLNDVLRSRENTYGLASSAYSYGSMIGTSFIDSRASRQRKQFQITYSLSNRQYDNRLMATYGSGLMKGGWSFSGSISRRWSEEGYIKGTYYDGWSWFMSVEKQLGLKHNLSLTQFGANTENGRAAASTREAYDLAGSHYYNPYWGYQNGKVRNASIAHQQQPLTVLGHEWKMDEHTTLQTSLGYQFGTYSTTALDWYNAADPRPDYYRNLPSYTKDSLSNAELIELWQNDESIRQIKWDSLYNFNRRNTETITDVDGIAGNNVTGLRSQYIVEERIVESQRISFNSTMNSTIGDHFTLTKGFSYQHQESEYYKRVNDLLGGDFYVDLNKYAEFSYPGNTTALQNNLLSPNHIVRVGDKFGYDYIAYINKSMFWAQGQWRYNKVDFFLSGNISNTNFYREGLNQNGVFINNSLGDSPKQSFNNFGVKGGATYKFNGRNYIYGNAAFETRAPLFENVYLSPRTRNTVANNLGNEEVISTEGGYMLRAPKVKVRLTGYYTQFNNQINTVSFYNEAYNSFVNYTISKIDKRHVGFEFGADVNVGYGFTLTGALSVGEYFYNSRQKYTATEDNTADILADRETIYSKNFYVDGSPQTAGSIGIGYRAKKFWYINASANYFDKMYIGFNPSRRTSNAVALLDGEDPLRAYILSQQQLDSQFTLDISGGKSWKLNGKIKSLKRNTFLVLNAGISNLLDNQDFVTTGFEQLRFDFDEKDPDKFNSKYYYGFGRTYFVNLTLRFN